MAQLLRELDSSTDTKPVSNTPEKEPHTLRSFVGTTTKDLSRRVGWLTLNAARWWQEERSYGITGAGIFFSVFFIALSIGLFMGLKFQKERFTFGGKTFVVVGMGAIADQNGQMVYAPVYKELK